MSDSSDSRELLEEIRDSVKALRDEIRERHEAAKREYEQRKREAEDAYAKERRTSYHFWTVILVMLILVQAVAICAMAIHLYETSLN